MADDDEVEEPTPKTSTNKLVYSYKFIIQTILALTAVITLVSGAVAYNKTIVKKDDLTKTTCDINMRMDLMYYKITLITYNTTQAQLRSRIWSFEDEYRGKVIGRAAAKELATMKSELTGLNDDIKIIKRSLHQFKDLDNLYTTVIKP